MRCIKQMPETPIKGTLPEWFPKWLPKLFYIRYGNIYKTAMTGRSRTAAIKAKCLDCSNWQRAEIEKCPVVDCPLYPYKPYPSKQTQKARKEKV